MVELNVQPVFGIMAYLTIKFHYFMGHLLTDRQASCHKGETSKKKCEFFLKHELILSSRMTVVAGNAVILIIRYILVFIGQIYRIIMLMAKDTFKNSKIICIHMTLSTETPGTSVSSGIDREILTIMIPGGLSPGSGIVASLTESRKSSGGMIRILTGIVVILMTSVASGGSSGIASSMTIDTG